MQWFSENNKIKVLMTSRKGARKNPTSTNTHIACLAKNMHSDVEVVVDIAELEAPIPEPFVSFILELYQGQDFAKLKQNLSYDMKLIINKVRKKVKDTDVIHTHHTGSFFEALIAKLFFDKKLVVTFHSILLKQEELKSTLGAEIYKQCLYLEALIGMYADAVIVTYKNRKKDVNDYYPSIDNAKIHTVYNGIDTNEFYQSCSLEVLEKYSINSTVPYVIIVGRVRVMEDFDYIMQLASKLFIVFQIVFSIRLPDDEEFRNYFNDKLENLKKNRIGAIFIEENLSNYDRQVLYSQASVVCYPLIYEPSSFTLLEVLSCGTPVVSTAVGCAKEIIKHGESGFLVEAGLTPNFPFSPSDKEGFITRISEATNRILENKSLIKRLSLRTRETVEQMFKWQTVAEKTIAIYQKIIRN